MNSKYELLTDETIKLCDRTLYRIRAIRDFADVKAGEKGGYIECEANLAIEGDAWVYGDAQVYGDAWVYGNAQVCGDAQVYGDAWVCGNAQVCGDAQVYGNARVCGDAQVYGNAWVCGNARVCGNAWVCGNAHYLCVGPIGSRNDTITFMRTKEGEIMAIVGCFCGGIEQFEKQVKSRHGDNEHARAYMLAAELARMRIDLSTDKENEETTRE